MHSTSVVTHPSGLRSILAGIMQEHCQHSRHPRDCARSAQSTMIRWRAVTLCLRLPDSRHVSAAAPVTHRTHVVAGINVNRYRVGYRVYPIGYTLCRINPIGCAPYILCMYPIPCDAQPRATSGAVLSPQRASHTGGIPRLRTAREGEGHRRSRALARWSQGMPWQCFCSPPFFP